MAPEARFSKMQAGEQGAEADAQPVHSSPCTVLRSRAPRVGLHCATLVDPRDHEPLLCFYLAGLWREARLVKTPHTWYCRVAWRRRRRIAMSDMDPHESKHR